MHQHLASEKLLNTCLNLHLEGQIPPCSAAAEQCPQCWEHGCAGGGRWTRCGGHVAAGAPRGAGLGGLSPGIVRLALNRPRHVAWGKLCLLQGLRWGKAERQTWPNQKPS